MRPIRALISLALLGIAAGCGGGGGDGGGPTAGVLNVTLNTPTTGDGAVLFRITGGPVDSVVKGAMAASFSSHKVANTTRIVAAGPITDGVIAHLYVSDVSKASSYVGTMEQVAANSNFAQRSVTGYTLTITAAP